MVAQTYLTLPPNLLTHPIDAHIEFMIAQAGVVDLGVVECIGHCPSPINRRKSTLWKWEEEAEEEGEYEGEEE